MNNETIFKFTAEIFSHDLHTKRVVSLSNTVTGVIKNCSPAIHLIRKGLSQAKGSDSKHTIKQVDRLLSNDGINLEALFPVEVKPYPYP